MKKGLGAEGPPGDTSQLDGQVEHVPSSLHNDERSVHQTFPPLPGLWAPRAARQAPGQGSRRKSLQAELLALKQDHPSTARCVASQKVWKRT